VALPDLWALELLLAAFAGGAFGAAIGALPSFALAGVMVIVGEVYALAGRTIGTPAPVDITNGIGFGVVLGPHVAFGGGAAAVAYAARRGYLDSGFDYHPAKEVTRGLGARPDVLAVGGAFGVVGYWIATLSGSLGVPVDPVATGVVGSALVHRVVLGYSVVGAPVGRLLDMTPFEEGRRRDDGSSTGGDADAATDGGAVEPAGPTAPAGSRDGSGTGAGTGSGSGTDGRLLVEPWLDYQYRWDGVALLGAVLGILGALVAYRTGSPFLAFGISVAALVFVNADVAEIPVTHHMTLPASTVVLALAGGSQDPAAIAAALPLGVALVAGAILGLVGALAGEYLQRCLYAHAETHLDPPAASIVVTSFALGVLAVAGVLPSSVWIPTP
jgi:hypothetical protein